MGPGSSLAVLACPGRRSLFSDSTFKQQIHVRVLAARPARGLHIVVPQEGGSRECRMRAAPAVSCAKCTSKNAHEHTGQRRTSDIPCAMALRLMTRSPRRIWTLLSPSPYGIWQVSPVGLSAPPQDLTPTLRQSGPHAFAVRFDTARQHVLKTAHGVYPALQSFSAHDAAASTASHPNVR
jgi:hypothetical protein